MTRRFIQPIRPVLNRKHPLYRGLRYGCIPGWVKGFEDTGGIVAKDDVTNIQGVIQGSKGGHFTLRQFGRAYGPGSSIDATTWGGAQLAFSQPNNGHFTIAALIRVNNAGGISNLDSIISRGAFSAANSFGLNFNADPDLRLYTFDGGGSGDSVTDVATVSTGDVILIVGTSSGNPDNSLTIYRNGQFANVFTPGGPNPVGARTVVVSLHGDNTGGQNADVDIGMVGIWDRELSQNSVSSLWVDPFSLWKDSVTEDGLGLVPAGSSGIVGNNCCKWVTPSLGWIRNQVW